MEAFSLDVSLPYDIIETGLPFTARLKTEHYSLTYCSASCQSIRMPMTIIGEDIEITLEPPRPVSSYLVSYHSICFLIPPLFVLSFILNDEGLAWVVQSVQTCARACAREGKVGLPLYVCPTFLPSPSLSVTLGLYLAISHPVQPSCLSSCSSSHSKSSSHLSVLDLPTAPHCSQGEPYSTLYASSVLHVRLIRICPGPPHMASKKSLNVLGFAVPSALALKVSLSQGSWCSLPPALQQVLRYIWQRSENVKKAGLLTHTHPTFSFKVSHLLPVYLQTVLQGIPGSSRKRKHTLEVGLRYHLVSFADVLFCPGKPFNLICRVCDFWCPHAWWRGQDACGNLRVCQQ